MAQDDTNPRKDKPKRFKFIGCEIIYREACLLAARGRHQVDVQFMLKGLHDLPTEDMLTKLQATVDAVEEQPGYDAIILGYARCNDGLVGLRARSIPMVIPRAHDCITFFFGSRDRYMAYFNEYPGTYFLTSGWSERNNQALNDGGYSRPAYGMEGVMGKLGLAEPYDDMVAKYGKENADFIVESTGGWLQHYTRTLYLEMGVCDETQLIEKARRTAEKQKWEFELRKGDWSLLEKLFSGAWDDDFLIVPPGAAIVARNDEAVLDIAQPDDSSAHD